MLIFQLRCFLIISQYLKELYCQLKRLSPLKSKPSQVISNPSSRSIRERKDRHSFYSNKLSQKKSKLFFSHRSSKQCLPFKINPFLARLGTAKICNSFVSTTLLNNLFLKSGQERYKIYCNKLEIKRLFLRI